MAKEQLYEKYRKLIYKVIKDKHCVINNDEDFQTFYDAGLLGLLKGINSFNKKQQETTTYFYNCISNGINVEIVNQNRNKRKINYLHNKSLDYCLDDTLYYEIIPDETINIELEIIKKDQYETLYKAINMLKPSYKKLICQYYGIKCNNMTLEQIANVNNVSRQAVNVKKNNALKELKKNYIKLGGINE